jgi:hypothetical protein
MVPVGVLQVKPWLPQQTFVLEAAAIGGGVSTLTESTALVGGPAPRKMRAFLEGSIS